MIETLGPVLLFWVYHNFIEGYGVLYKSVSSYITGEKTKI